MARKNNSWTFCPTCNELLLVSTSGGHSRAFPLGNKGKTLISALVSEQLNNPKFSEFIDKILKDLSSHPATIKLTKKPKRGRPTTRA